MQPSFPQLQSGHSKVRIANFIGRQNFSKDYLRQEQTNYSAKRRTLKLPGIDREDIHQYAYAGNPPLCHEDTERDGPYSQIDLHCRKSLNLRINKCHNVITRLGDTHEPIPATLQILQLHQNLFSSNAIFSQKINAKAHPRKTCCYYFPFIWL